VQVASEFPHVEPLSVEYSIPVIGVEFAPSLKLIVNDSTSVVIAVITGRSGTAA
jgi:hypothetical protein